MIEEYKLNYEVALARKAKLHCHPSEAYDFAWKNGFYNLNELASVSSKIASHYGIDAGELWDASRSSTKNKKDARSHVVYFLMAWGLTTLPSQRFLASVSPPSNGVSLTRPRR
jgi:hypothetical protein